MSGLGPLDREKWYREGLVRLLGLIGVWSNRTLENEFPAFHGDVVKAAHLPTLEAELLKFGSPVSIPENLKTVFPLSHTVIIR